MASKHVLPAGLSEELETLKSILGHEIQIKTSTDGTIILCIGLTKEIGESCVVTFMLSSE